jgi:hypothetical protein
MQMLTRFTPVAYPAQLIGLRVWFRNAASPSPFKIIVKQDSSSTSDANNATLVYMSPSPITNPAENGIPDSTYSYYSDLTAENLYFNSGDIYAGISQNSQQNGFVGLALDTNYLSLNDRQWISTSQGVSGSWFQFTSGTFIQAQLGITAYFHYIQDDVGIISSGIVPSVYPIPARDYFKVKNLPSENFFISVFDLAGRLQTEFHEDASSNSFDVSTLGKGIYIVRFKSEKEDRFMHFKLIKE